MSGEEEEEGPDVDTGGVASRLGLPGQSLLVGMAAVLKRKTNQVELAKLAEFGYRKVNKFLNGIIGRADPTEQLLRALGCRPAEVRILWARGIRLHDGLDRRLRDRVRQIVPIRAGFHTQRQPGAHHG